MITEWVFEKRNGEIRILRGTRDFEWVKREFPEDWVEPQGKKKTPDHLMLVWDIENRGFRTIDPDSIISERRVQYKTKNVKLSDKNWYKHNTWKPTCIIRGKTPYWILVALDAIEPSLIELQAFVDFYYPTKHTDTNVKSVLEAFQNSGLVKKEFNRYYSLTQDGHDFFEKNVWS